MTEEQKDKAKELLDSIVLATRFWVDATQTGIIKAEEKAIMEAMQQYAEWYAKSLLPSEEEIKAIALEYAPQINYIFNTGIRRDINTSTRIKTIELLMKFRSRILDAIKSE